MSETAVEAAVDYLVSIIGRHQYCKPITLILQNHNDDIATANIANINIAKPKPSILQTHNVDIATANIAKP